MSIPPATPPLPPTPSAAAGSPMSPAPTAPAPAPTTGPATTTAAASSAAAGAPGRVSFTQTMFVDDPEDPTAKRLVQGVSALAGIEEFMRTELHLARDAAIPPQQIKSVKGKFKNEDNNYGTENKTKAIQAKTFDLKFTDGKDAKKKAFCFEVEWQMTLEKPGEVPKVVKLRQTIYTNVEVPEVNDPYIYEKAKERALNVAMHYQNTLKIAANPNDPNHEVIKQSLDVMRTHHAMSFNFKGEKPEDFGSKAYLTGTYRKVDMADATITIGDILKPNECKSFKVNLHKNRKPGKTKIGHKLQGVKVVTAPSPETVDKRKMEIMERLNILVPNPLPGKTLQEALNENSITPNEFADYLKAKLKEDQKAFEELSSDLIPPAISSARNWGVRATQLERIEKAIRDKTNPPDLQTEIDELKDAHNELVILKKRIDDNYKRWKKLLEVFPSEITDKRVGYLNPERDLARNEEKLKKVGARINPLKP